MTEYFVRMWKEKKYRAIIILVHFLLSFIYERFILIFQLDKDVVLAEAMNYIVSDRTERIFGYVTEKIFAFLFIVALWSIIWAFVDGFKKLYIKVLFLVWLAIVFIIVATYPVILDGVWDAYETYSYGIRLWPEYWHSAYSSLIFGGMLMVFPSPVAIQILQPLFGVGAIGYLYKRMVDSPVLKGRGRHFVWLLFLMPSWFKIFTSPYRTDQYAIYSIFVFSVLVMDIVDKKERPAWERVAVLFLLGFFSVWRTEGIVIGFFLIVVAVFACEKSKIEKAAMFITYLIITILLMIPQKLGDVKYYGKDYQFINSFSTLYNIMNDTAHDLSYEGAEDDLAAIEKVVPLDILTYRGIDGYRRYNFAQGRPDINQSMVDRKTGAAYMKAYYNLVRHNLKLYAKTQITAMAASMGFIDDIYTAPYIGGAVIDYPMWMFAGWSNGREDILERKYIKEWSENITRQNMVAFYFNTSNNINSFFGKIFYRPIVLSIVILSLAGVAIKELICLFKKKYKRFSLGVICVSVLVELFAILLVMPEDSLAYIQPTICGGIIALIVYFALGSVMKKEP